MIRRRFPITEMEKRKRKKTRMEDTATTVTLANTLLKINKDTKTAKKTVKRLCRNAAMNLSVSELATITESFLVEDNTFFLNERTMVKKWSNLFTEKITIKTIVKIIKHDQNIPKTGVFSHQNSFAGLMVEIVELYDAKYPKISKLLFYCTKELRKNFRLWIQELPIPTIIRIFCTFRSFKDVLYQIKKTIQHNMKFQLAQSYLRNLAPDSFQREIEDEDEGLNWHNLRRADMFKRVICIQTDNIPFKITSVGTELDIHWTHIGRIVSICSKNGILIHSDTDSRFPLFMKPYTFGSSWKSRRKSRRNMHIRVDESDIDDAIRLYNILLESLPCSSVICQIIQMYAL